ncbi:MAG: LytR/AlgR family response regulator transcription factor [Gaiellaceae bacterium]
MEQRRIRALIVDDEPLARKRIQRLLKEEPDVEVVGECADGRQAVAAIRRDAPDLVFLDVQMPELDGFGVLEAVGAERMPAVVFVTAYDEHALRAFEVSALDYLMKPFLPERFQRALKRARRQLRSDAEGGTREKLLELLALVGGGRRHLDRLLIKNDSRVYFLKAEEIDWIEAAGNYVQLHVGKDVHLLRETMARLEAGLDPARFLRIHRSTIVNLDRVKEMHPWFSGELVVLLHDGTQLRLSRGYRGKMEERLGRSL